MLLKSKLGCQVVNTAFFHFTSNDCGLVQKTA